ncbi:NfeD family protein [Blastochloris viridis]|uniref:Inner membrane protein ybbJ n=1 Tax=Blastochloris viridis TaxID=1079 RepID=A0A0H5BH31_BLAVI|nr:NfeD family protein [Blastochloris viridis]ALK10343.1 Inner membrane protein YbbJ [Blastochloris viridis]BAR99721.1 putative activity regulator of membrane protease YbbK [Blastochloris viridis]CUU43005.1 Inner membrane protein ybbJ [Blastochloris viridis]
MSAFSALGVWIWFILGLVLLGAEVALPGFFMLWLGVAALATGLITLALGLPWQAEFIVFGVLSVAALVVWLRLAKQASEAPADNPFLNRRAAGYVGREFLLEEAIVRGAGRVRIDDSVWRLAGPDLPAGSRVRVTRADGGLLHVEATGG